jgi:hypothetical protein
MKSRRLMTSPTPRTTPNTKKKYHIFGLKIVPFVIPSGGVTPFPLWVVSGTWPEAKSVSAFASARPLVFAEEPDERRGISRVVLLHRHGHHAETLRLKSAK